MAIAALVATKNHLNLLTIFLDFMATFVVAKGLVSWQRLGGGISPMWLATSLIIWGVNS